MTDTNAPVEQHLADQERLRHLGMVAEAVENSDYANATSEQKAHWQEGYKSALRAQPAPQADEWQPIESAPRDGTAVLITDGTVRYDAECFPDERIFEGVTIGIWSSYEAAWHGGYGSEYDAVYWHYPTHWRPLPAPPLAKEADHGE